ncbi:Hsp20/alpha crystallin family protein [Luteimonas sp. SJ-92]|uniref:Hsp20/alpha crystallin family protein n=1 Tax=Luteimonas salinisoli TaxID=2752307 RepID=A0A853JG70_9GAMM|nr:Hsp20/alpha crystallin family protein [Luteimonas salinisoli]NZA27845.1 Hsp20/alpha crystallin family protein [Luteimonas salinisoli]
MSTLTRWNPFRTLSRFDPAPGGLDDLFRGMSLRPLLREFENAAVDMRMDVQEADKAYQVSVEVPGAKKEDIEISVEGSQVSIQAEVRGEEIREDHRQVHTERYAGRSTRSFTLPQEIDVEGCTAQYEDGILRLTLPKKANGAATRIAVD